MSNRNMFGDCVFLLGMLMLAAGMFLAAKQRDELKEEAVKRGYAEWEVSASGNAKWKWKEMAK